MAGRDQSAADQSQTTWLKVDPINITIVTIAKRHSRFGLTFSYHPPLIIAHRWSPLDWVLSSSSQLPDFSVP